MVDTTLVRVFISYAWDVDDPQHGEAVRGLAELLRSQGVDARLDRYAEDEPRDWPLWMMEQFREADFVIVVASAAYRRRADGLADSGEGRGVQFEAAILRDLVLDDRARWSRKILTVLLPGATIDDIPQFLGPYSRTRYPVTLSPAGVAGVVRVLTGQSEFPPPPVGPVAVLPRAPSALTGMGVPGRGDTGGALQVASCLVELRVVISGGQATTVVSVDGTARGTRTAMLPYGLDEVFRGTDPTSVESRLVEEGRRLADALLDPSVLAEIVALIDQAAFGAIMDVQVVATGEAIGVPYELLRAPDGRLLATLPGVRFLRRMDGVARSAGAVLAGPLKILVAVAAPDETRTRSAPLDVEAEMQAVLDAVSGVEARGDAQVSILEVGALDHIGAALRRDQYHVLHLSAHGSATAVELENEDGEPVAVGTAELVAHLKGVGRPLPLIVLSSCAGAAAAGHGLAAALVAAGADRVIAMQTAVTDRYATALTGAIYRILADNPAATVAGALADARRELEADRAAAAAAGRLEPAEYATATLIAAGQDLPLRDLLAPSQPLVAPFVPPSGRSVRDLPMGYLIGRRPERRDGLAILRGTSAAKARWGAMAGVAYTGIGGIGKTAIAGRLAARLRNDGWQVAVHDGRWNPTALFTAVADAIAANAQDAAGILRADEVAEVTKFDRVLHLLREHKMLLVFDDFEQNLTVGGDSFLDPTVATLFEDMCQAASAGRLLVTCRYQIPGTAGTLAEIPVGPLSPAELRRFLHRLPALRDLRIDDRRVIARTVGGHPRLLEFVDALLRHGHAAELRSVTTQLRKLAGDAGVDLSTGRDLPQAVTDAIRLGSANILLTELLGLLTDREREVVLQAAVSLTPIDLDDLSYALRSEAEDHTTDTTSADIERLLALTLISPVGSRDIVVHPWVSQALQSHQGDQVNQRHRRAVGMRVRRINSPQRSFDDFTEVVRHLSVLGDHDGLGLFAIEAVESGLLGQLSVVAFLGEVLPELPTTSSYYLPVADAEARALLASGNTEAAAPKLMEIHHIVERAAADPSNAQAQRDLSISYKRLGDLMRAVGNLPEAERFYRDGLAIAERLAAAEPSNAEAQRDRSVSYNRLGDLMRAVGNLPEAERFYRDGLAIAERLAAADPSNAEAQRDRSVSYERLGDLMRAVGNLPEAERFYRDALNIRERLAAADPSNAEAQRDRSVSYNNLGDLMRAVGNLPEAERFYRQYLAIAERLAAADPSNAEAQRDRSVSYERLGDLMRAVGNLPEAERFYRDALNIRERLAAADPSNAQAQRDLSISYNNLGDLMRAVGNLPEAERFYRQYLAIAERLAAADPSNAQAQRDRSISYNNLGDLMRAVGNLPEAERFYRQYLAIAERLAAADPSNAQAQRDRSVSYNRLGELMRAVGNLPEAERFYRQDLAIAERLAAAEPSNAQAQRDLSISYNNLGELMRAVGNLPEAERFYRDGLAIAERLAAAEPSNAEAQRDLSVSYNKLGDLMRAVGNLPEAERFYRDGLAIAERLAAADPSNAEAQRDRSVSYERLGDLMRAVGNLPEAERFYRDALNIRERLAAADPSNAQAQRDRSVSYERLGDLMRAVGNLPEAERFYRQYLAIAERLAAADPSNAQAQRDLSVSYNNLGELMRAVGNLPEAERFYRQYLAIAERLATADPSNAQAQRDRSVSYNNLGDLMRAVGNLPEAERFYRQYLAIAERLAAADRATPRPNVT